MLIRTCLASVSAAALLAAPAVQSAVAADHQPSQSTARFKLTGRWTGHIGNEYARKRVEIRFGRINGKLVGKLRQYSDGEMQCASDMKYKGKRHGKWFFHENFYKGTCADRTDSFKQQLGNRLLGSFRYDFLPEKGVLHRR